MTEHEDEIRRLVHEAFSQTAKEVAEKLISQILQDPSAPLKVRVVSIKAKNLEPGAVIEWPGWEGSSPAHNVSVEEDRVLATGAGQRFAVFDKNQRVRVHRG